MCEIEIMTCEIWICTFSTIFRSVLMLRIHQPTPTALSSDHCGSPLCMAGIMFNSSSSASEWKAHAKWHVDRPAIEGGGREDSIWGSTRHYCKSQDRVSVREYLPWWSSCMRYKGGREVSRQVWRRMASRYLNPHSSRASAPTWNKVVQCCHSFPSNHSIKKWRPGTKFTISRVYLCWWCSSRLCLLSLNRLTLAVLT